MNILLTGATGFIGYNLLNSLKSDDKKKIYYIYRNQPVEIKSNNIFPIKGSLFNLKEAEKIKKIDIIIHCAGLTKAYYEYEYFLVNTRGTTNLINLAKNKNVKQFIFLSSLAASGPSINKTPITENHKEKPVSNYGLSKLIGEKILKSSKINYTIIRPPAVYGPKEKDIFTYFKLINKGLAIITGVQEKFYSMIYVKDLVNFILKIVYNQKAYNETFFYCNENIYSTNDIINNIAKALNKKIIKIRLPDFFNYPIFYLAHNFNKFTQNPPLLNIDKLNEIKQKYWICSSKKAYDLINIKPQYSLEKGMLETAEWYKRNKWL